MGIQIKPQGINSELRNRNLINFDIEFNRSFYNSKKLLAKGLQTKNPTNEIKRLMINGISLMILSILAIIKYEYPYGLWGCMIFIESAVSFSYAQKLLKK